MSAVDTRLRFIVKPLGQGRTRTFGVYDTERGSYPTHHPDSRFGRIAQDHPTEQAAQVEADRLNQETR